MNTPLRLQRFTQQGEGLHVWSEVEASAEAVKLYSLCNSAYPAGEEELRKVVLKDILNTAFRFAVHARRVLEFEGDHTSQVVETGTDNHLARYYSETFSFEKNLRKAINKIIHARKIAILMDRGEMRGNEVLQFDKADMVVAFEIQSDQGEAFHVVPQGVAWGYLLRGQTAEKGTA
ncbi:hypothetical protein [Leisingera aquaemixtae]|uniref:hypothetical protein n=1 Tax=Leisingera aquaemixtae TaxID=1396826 RepID=UPI0011AE82D4|nr:hypothetical protein [Leisingera aquaemixtae]